MRYNKSEMRAAVFNQLAIDLNCKPDDLNKDGIVFCAARENPGRRPYPREQRHFELLAAGKSAIVCASDDIMPFLKEQLAQKTRAEAFAMPFVCGIGLFFLPDTEKIKPLSPVDDFDYKIFDKLEVPSLYEFKGFNNALQYDVNAVRPDSLAITASKNGKIVGIAGATDDCAQMWQIGIEVADEYRSKGVASYLVNAITFEIMARGYIPYY